jgi:hypothetical protein
MLMSPAKGKKWMHGGVMHTRRRRPWDVLYRVRSLDTNRLCWAPSRATRAAWCSAWHQRYQYPTSPFCPLRKTHCASPPLTFVHRVLRSQRKPLVVPNIQSRKTPASQLGALPSRQPPWSRISNTNCERVQARHIRGSFQCRSAPIQLPFRDCPLTTWIKQMIAGRLSRAATLRHAALPPRWIPVVQKRGFTPPSFTSKKIIDEKYPDYPKLTEAEDPGMVRPRRL